MLLKRTPRAAFHLRGTEPTTVSPFIPRFLLRCVEDTAHTRVERRPLLSLSDPTLAFKPAVASGLTRFLPGVIASRAGLGVGLPAFHQTIE